MTDTSLLTSTATRIEPLGFRWVSYLHLWLLVAAIGASAAVLVAARFIRIHVTAPASGVLVRADSSTLSSRVSGVVEEVLVDEGDTVASGDVLLYLRSDELRRHLRLLQADLTSQVHRQLVLQAEIDAEGRRRRTVVTELEEQARVAAAELDRVRTIQSLPIPGRRPTWRRRPLDELIPVRRAAEALHLVHVRLQSARQDARAISSRQAEVDWMEAQRQRLLTQRNQLYERLGEHTLRADRAGIIQTADPGHLEGKGVEVGQVLLELSTSTDWLARMTVSEYEWGKIKPGQRAQLFVEAYPHVRHGAIPAQVEAISAQSEGVTGYPVRLQIDGVDVEDLALAEGMRVAAQITIQKASVVELLHTWLARQFRHARPLQSRLAFFGGRQ